MVNLSSAFGSPTYISVEKGKGNFPLSTAGRSTSLCVSSQDFPGVSRVARLLQADVGRVTGSEPELHVDAYPPSTEIILIGTLGKNPVIDQLVRDNRMDVSGIAGNWETFLIQVIDKPLDNVDRALIIAGSDKRGTLYGMLDLSARIGVSPWYWWADVPVPPQGDLFVVPGRHTQGEPAVKYRGIFINDEVPALSKWAGEKFGGFNHRFYEKVFELILRLKGNYLWPAMWGSAFNDDDPANPRLADEYGIVMGTSHHEPMMRAHAEWARYGTGPWNYMANQRTLEEFWTQGVRDMGVHESIVTIGMRGDGDLPMTEEANITLLETIVKRQREIIKDITGQDPASIPQLWALYKEVQEYYDKGMCVPEDVTLLLCDDNWGNIRRLPKLTDSPRAGGYGIYYHFDYVGAPRNYKWLNTSPLPRVWEQMHLAYQYGVDRIWIVNVGDIKPLELPIQFFLDYAWSPDEWPLERLPEYTRYWAEQQFGPEHAEEIAGILDCYTRFNGRRKPELLAPETYSLVNYREAETIGADYNDLVSRAERIHDILSDEYKDAYYQLVLHPVRACANLNELYITVGKNRLYSRQGRAATNDMADRARVLFARDAEYSRYYDEALAGGKWGHMMDQTHIGYTTWQQPKANVMPRVEEISIPDSAEMGVAIEGSEDWWPMADGEPLLPAMDCYHQQTTIIEIFNRGKAPFDYHVQPGAPWLSVIPSQGTVERECRLVVGADWAHVPFGSQHVPITIAGPNGSRVVVKAVVHHPESPARDAVQGFVEGDGYVSMEAEHYSRAVTKPPIKWQCIPNLGRTLSAMTPFPVTAQSQALGVESPRLEYRMVLFGKGLVRVQAHLSPTLDFHNEQGLRYAISFDDETPQIVYIHADNSDQAWGQSVSDNIRVTVSEHHLAQAGEHVLKFWMVDPGVVLQKLVVATGDTRSSYLGPPESFHRPVDSVEG